MTKKTYTEWVIRLVYFAQEDIVTLSTESLDSSDSSASDNDLVENDIFSN